MEAIRKCSTSGKAQISCEMKQKEANKCYKTNVERLSGTYEKWYPKITVFLLKVGAATVQWFQLGPQN